MAKSNLVARVQQLREKAQGLPTRAASELEDLVAQGERKQQSPDGERWQRVEGRRFDPGGHIHYEASTEGALVHLSSSHRAARYTRWGTRHMPSRAKVPKGDGLGWWLPKLLRALRARMK